MCAEFLASRGNLDEDLDAIITLVKSGMDAGVSYVLNLIFKRGNRSQDFKLITEWSKAGAKYAEIKSLLEFVTRCKHSEHACKLMFALSKAKAPKETKTGLYRFWEIWQPSPYQHILSEAETS